MMNPGHSADSWNPEVPQGTLFNSSPVPTFEELLATHSEDQCGGVGVEGEAVQSQSESGAFMDPHL